MKKQLTRALLAAAITGCALWPEIASACAVCGGDPEAPMSQGMSMGILSLLIITGGMLFAFASFFLFLRVRARATAHETAPNGREEALA